MSATTQPELGFDELRPPLGPAEAVVEADRCLECGGPHAPAPCAVACPAGVDVARFIAQIADGDPGAAAETIFEENILGAHLRARLPGRGPVRGRLRPRARGPAADRDRRAPALRDGLVLRARSTPPDARSGHRPTGRRHRRRPVRPRLCGRARRAGLRRDRLRRARGDRRARPLRDRPVSPGARPASRRGARAGGARRRASARHADRQPRSSSRRLPRARMPSSSESASGRTRRFRTPATSCTGVWESLPFIEAIKTGQPPKRRQPRGRDRRRQHGDRRRARGAAARRGRRDDPLPPHRGRDARLRRTRSRRRARRASGSASSRRPVAFLGDLAPGAGRVRRDDARRARRERPPPTGAAARAPSSRFPRDTAVKAIGQQSRDELADWIDGLELDRARSWSTRSGRTGNRKFFAGGDAINGGASVVEAVRDGKRAAEAIDRELRCRS